MSNIPDMPNITVILVSPESDGNIGAVCRSMKNFRISNLIIVNPKAPLEYETIKPYSMHGYDIYENSRKEPNLDFLKDYDTIIAFTGNADPDSKILRQPVPLKLITSNIRKKTALLFGRESSGLTNEELSRADMISTIPASRDYPTLNLSHAVTIVLYELFDKKYETIPDPMTAATKNTLIITCNALVEKGSFKNPDVVRLAFKRIITKSDISEKEAKAVLSLFSKLKNGSLNHTN